MQAKTIEEIFQKASDFYNVNITFKKEGSPVSFKRDCKNELRSLNSIRTVFTCPFTNKKVYTALFKTEITTHPLERVKSFIELSIISILNTKK